MQLLAIAAPNDTSVCSRLVNSLISLAKSLLVGYRLAPEYPHPAAVDDAVSAYRWLLGNGYSSEDIVGMMPEVKRAIDDVGDLIKNHVGSP
jgi:hypothetical protein